MRIIFIQNKNKIKRRVQSLLELFSNQNLHIPYYLLVTSGEASKDQTDY